MLEELRKYKNLGTPTFYWELLDQITIASHRWTEEDVHKYFYNRIVDNRNIFDGCIPLLISCEIISIDTDGYLDIDNSMKEYLINEQYLKNKTLERIFIKLADDDIFHQIFNSLNISYDIIYNYVQIENSAFTFRFSNFKQLLLDFDFLYVHPDEIIKKYIINTKFKKLFDAKILPQVKKRKMGIDELDKRLAKQRINGEEAEEFVLAFEKDRLKQSSNHKKVIKISDYDVAAGYDVVSFEDGDSEIHDRFIEVKSYVGDFNFFWSENEIEVSRRKSKQYFLYLVDRDKMNQSGYIPEIIQDPYTTVYNDDKWDLKPKKFHVSIKN